MPCSRQLAFYSDNVSDICRGNHQLIRFVCDPSLLILEIFCYRQILDDVQDHYFLNILRGETLHFLFLKVHLNIPYLLSLCIFQMIVLHSFFKFYALLL